MEMTKMLLPAVPSMGNHIHSNDKFDRRLYRNYHNLKEFRFRERIFLSQLKELETGNFLEVVRESLIENFDLLHIPYYESQRITRPSANEEYRYDFTTTPNEKKTEIQSNLRSKPEPQPEPKPQLEPKPNPEPEIEPKSKPETEIKSKPELELDFFAIDWSQKKIGLWIDDGLAQDLDLILKNGYDSDDGMITISEICKLYDSDDEFAKRTFPNDTNSKPTSMPIREQVKRCKEKRKDVFTKQEDGGNHTMWPILGPIKPCLSVNYQRMMPYDVQRRRYNTQTTLTGNLANRSLLKSQCNVNNTFSPTKWRNPLLTSNNPEKKLYDQNQDYQRKIVMPYTQQAIDSQDAEIKQLLSPSSSDDDLMETDTEVDEMPVFRHDHFNVNKLNEYLSEGASTSRGLPKNEEPAQRAKRHWRKTEENQRQIENNIMRNTLSDHCYHLNQPRSMLGRLELSDSSSGQSSNLLVGQPSNQSNRVLRPRAPILPVRATRTRGSTIRTRDEEIDVVSYERQMTQQNDPETTQQNVAQMLQQNIPQAMQPNIPQATQQNVPQTRRNTTSRANQDANENNTPPARRPRGRPPGPNSAKRRKTGQTNRTSDPGPSTSSSSRVQNHQRAERRQNSMSSRQNRNDNEKSQRRRMHNNMERMRRNGLKNMLDLVHKSIPAIKNNVKASKLVVLLHAREYILSMQEAESNLKYEKARLKMYNDRLEQRLNYLKRMSSLPRKH